MPADPILRSASSLDLSGRVSSSTAVTGSPAAASETVVCTLAANNTNCALALGALLNFTISYTVGTNGVSARYRIRQGTSAGAGTVVYDSGLTTVVAANLIAATINAVDTAAVMPGQAYCLTLTIGSGSAASTVSAAHGYALFV